MVAIKEAEDRRISTIDAIPIEVSLAAKTSDITIFVASDNKEFESVQNNITFFVQGNISKVISIPSPSAMPTFHQSYKEAQLLRAHGLSELVLNPSSAIIITTVESIFRKTIPPAYLKSILFNIKIGEETGVEHIAKNLLQLGYQPTTNASNIGEFAQKGELLDVIINQQSGLRIAFDHDIVESIRPFDAETGLTTKENLSNVCIKPSTEFVTNNTTLANFKSAYEANGLDKDSPEYENIVSGISHENLGRFAHFLYEKTSSFFDYLDPRATIILSPFFDSSAKRQSESIKKLAEQEVLGHHAKTRDLYIVEESEAIAALRNFKTLRLHMRS